MSYTITNIDTTTGNVTLSFDYDNRQQVIDCSSDLQDAEQLTAYLSDYERAYVAGKALEVKDAPTDLQALVGETIQTEN